MIKSSKIIQYLIQLIFLVQVVNAVGNIRTTIRLQAKGAPEKPEFLTVTSVGHSFVTLQWTPGFDGGVQSTRYTIAYRQSYRSSENDIDSDCFIPRRSGSGSSSADDWMEFDCQRSNPCNVTGLEQHQAYAFKVSLYLYDTQIVVSITLKKESED